MKLSPKPVHCIGCRSAFCNWYRSSVAGHAILSQEQAFLRRALKQIHAWKILQMGYLGWESEVLTEEQMRHYLIVDRQSCSDAPVSTVRSALDALPIEGKSMDVVIMPHSLEFESNPQQVLREARRVLRPEGKLIFLGFNPFSPYRLVRYRLCGRSHIPWCGHFISQHRMHDWLSLLDFEFNSESYCFTPSRKFTRLEKVVGKYTPAMTIGYAIVAIKRTYTMTPITPSWIGSRVFNPEPVSESISNYRDE